MYPWPSLSRPLALLYLLLEHLSPPDVTRCIYLHIYLCPPLECKLHEVKVIVHHCILSVLNRAKRILVLHLTCSGNEGTKGHLHKNRLGLAYNSAVLVRGVQNVWSHGRLRSPRGQMVYRGV